MNNIIYLKYYSRNVTSSKPVLFDCRQNAIITCDAPIKRKKSSSHVIWGHEKGSLKKHRQAASINIFRDKIKFKSLKFQRRRIETKLQQTLCLSVVSIKLKTIHKFPVFFIVLTKRWESSALRTSKNEKMEKTIK
jgi:hypothetical protein